MIRGERDALQGFELLAYLADLRDLSREMKRREDQKRRPWLYIVRKETER